MSEDDISFSSSLPPSLQRVGCVCCLPVSFPPFCHSVSPGVKPAPSLNRRPVWTGFSGKHFLSLMESWDRVMRSCDDVTLDQKDLESAFCIKNTRWCIYMHAVGFSLNDHLIITSKMFTHLHNVHAHIIASVCEQHHIFIFIIKNIKQFASGWSIMSPWPTLVWMLHSVVAIFLLCNRFSQKAKWVSSSYAVTVLTDIWVSIWGTGS